MNPDTHGWPCWPKKPWPQPQKTPTLSAGTGFIWVGVGVSLNYPRVTLDDPYLPCPCFPTTSVPCPTCPSCPCPHGAAIQASIWLTIKLLLTSPAIAGLCHKCVPLNICQAITPCMLSATFHSSVLPRIHHYWKEDYYSARQHNTTIFFSKISMMYFY